MISNSSYQIDGKPEDYLFTGMNKSVQTAPHFPLDVQKAVLDP